MRDLLIIFDSVRYDNFMAVYAATKWRKYGKVYKAYSHGTWTRPSVVSMLSGYLPQSEYGQPYKPSWNMLSPQVFHDREIPSWFLNSNAWMSKMAPSDYIEYSFLEGHSAPRIIERAKEITEMYHNFFIVMLLTETHIPYNYDPSVDGDHLNKVFKSYNNGEDNDAPWLARKYQKRGIIHLMNLVEPLFDLADRVFITSDHGDLMGEHHKVGHDPTFPFHKVLLEVPLMVIE